MDVMKVCNYIIPQYTSEECVNSYYSLGAVYNGKRQLEFLLQLSTFEQIDNSYYKNELMRKNQYNGITRGVEDESWDEWIEEIREDDERRYRALAKMCKGKKVCGFGCGNGGFLWRIAKEVASVTGLN